MTIPSFNFRRALCTRLVPALALAMKTMSAWRNWSMVVLTAKIEGL